MRKLGKLILILSAALITVMPVEVSALPKPHQTTGFDTYTYSRRTWSELPLAPAYRTLDVVSGNDLGFGDLKNPNDLFVDEKTGRMYIADTGNNRIISCSVDFTDPVSYQGVLRNDGSLDNFSAPTGVYVDVTGNIFIADSGNGRLISMAPDGTLVREYPKPVSSTFDRNVAYKPLKVAVGKLGDIYVIAEGIFEGILSLDENGEFQGYAGMIPVKPSAWQLFFRAISSRQQLSVMKAFLPISFLGMDMDEKDFVYTVNKYDKGEDVIKHLNPGGTNVMRNITGMSVIGDRGALWQGSATGNSEFADICYLGSGIVAAVDRIRSRIFFYQEDGTLLFAFGGSGTQYGCLSNPSAIDNDGYNLYVLDTATGLINFYEPTAFSICLLDGITYYENKDYDTANERFYQALQLCTNCEPAYAGIGKSFMRKGKYSEALKCFSLAGDRYNYSKALERVRQTFLKEHFTWIFGLLVLVGLILLVRSAVKRYFHKPKPGASDSAIVPEGRISAYLDSLDYCFYCAARPFKGFYAMKYEKRGTVAAASTLLILFAAVFMLKARLSGYLLRPGGDVNSLLEGIKAVLPILGFCAVNWCVTTLLDGEGRFKDIYMAMCYSLAPMIIVQVVLIAVSNVIILEEFPLYNAVEAITWVYTIFLILAGNLTVSDYTLSKTVGTALVTLLGMVVAVFLLTLLFNLCFEMFSFINMIYKDIKFRI